MLDAVPDPEIDIIGVSDPRLVIAVREMADRFRRRLGLLPYPVFDEAAAQQRLLAAVSGEELAGFALYRLPRMEVALTQLCVGGAWRGRGIARRLMTAISDRHKDRLGVKVKCRPDYEIDGMWERLGFARRATVPGRNSVGIPLTVWWLDHGHPDLFTLAEAAPTLKVAMDLNVLFDLARNGGARDGADDSRVLLGDDLADVIELVVTPEIYEELDRASRSAQSPARVLASRYGCLTADVERVEAAQRALIAHVQEGDTGFPRNDQDRSDARHIAEAACGGANVLVTRDDQMRERFARMALDEFGLRVLNPVDVVLHVDELATSSAYQPARLLGTEYEETQAGAGSETVLDRLLDKPGGEQRGRLVRRVRTLVKNGGRWTIVRAADGSPVACYALNVRADHMAVLLLRVAHSSLDLTLARQLLFKFRRHCRRSGLQEVRIVDDHVPLLIRRAAEYEEFRQTEHGLSSLVIDICGSASQVGEAARAASQSSGYLDIPALTPGLAALPAARIEKALWPAKLVDSALPSFVVPIRPHWSSELFDEPPGLFTRRSELGISLEHVYYRSATPSVLKYPARILWYVTGDGSRTSGAVIGSSVLDEIVEGDPEALYERFAHLGAYSRLAVLDQAGGRGRVQALRFSFTDLFGQPVPMDVLKSLATKHGGPGTLQGPQRVTSTMFAELWRAGSTKTVGGSR